MAARPRRSAAVRQLAVLAAGAALLTLVVATPASSRPAAGFTITALPPVLGLHQVSSDGTQIFDIAVSARWRPEALHDEGRVRFNITRGVTTPDFGFHDEGNALHASATYRSTIAALPGTRALVSADWTVYTPKPFGRDEAKKTSPNRQLYVPSRPPASRLNSVQKDADSKWAYRSAVVCAFFTAGGAILLAIPGGQPVAVAMLVTGGLACGASLAFNELAQDPVDLNFRTIAKPNPPPAPKVSAGEGFPPAAATAFNALFAVQVQEIGLARAILTAFDRSQGAHVKRNTSWEKQQVFAAGRYAAQLSRLMLKEVALRRQAAAFLDLEPVSEDDAYRFGDGIAVGGVLPAELTSVLSKLRLTKSEQATVKAQVGAMSPQLYTGDPVSAFTGAQAVMDLRSAAASFKAFASRVARDPLAIP